MYGGVVLKAEVLCGLPEKVKKVCWCIALYGSMNTKFFKSTDTSIHSYSILPHFRDRKLGVKGPVEPNSSG